METEGLTRAKEIEAQRRNHFLLPPLADRRSIAGQSNRGAGRLDGFNNWDWDTLLESLRLVKGWLRLRSQPFLRLDEHAVGAAQMFGMGEGLKLARFGRCRFFPKAILDRVRLNPRRFAGLQIA
jgi:hypothetical protein